MKEIAYLFIHGFGGDLSDIEYLSQYLQTKKFDVHTVLLPGHGGTKQDLKTYSYTDWLASAGTAIESLRKEYNHIVLIGFSMGGLISLHFAPIPTISKIVLINTPIYYWNIKVVIKDVISCVRHKRYAKLRYYKKSIFGISIKSGIDFLKILYKTKKNIGKIKKPVLITQCKEDESVQHRSARYIKDKIGDSAILRYYDGGCHLVLVESPEIRDILCDDICQFLRQNEY